jgi:ubiquinone/menaquinone biosynthesis C-methylase UbiE
VELALANISRAFSKQAPKFDEEDFSNPILQWMRARVRKHVHKYLEPADRILELNAGTGLDSVYFAQKGYPVHATDLSEQMVFNVENKIDRYQLAGNLTCQQLSFTNLQQITNGPFDYIFSNFGGLNCVNDLGKVSEGIKHVLTPGGYVTLVIMPPVCLWELATLLKGNFKQAFRRFRRGGNLAHLEGERFMVHYFTPRDIQNAFGPQFKTVAVEGLGTFCPPPHRKKFALEKPGLLKALTGIDEKLSSFYPFNTWADHFIITLWYCPLI